MYLRAGRGGGGGVLLFTFVLCLLLSLQSERVLVRRRRLGRLLALGLRRGGLGLAGGDLARGGRLPRFLLLLLVGGL